MLREEAEERLREVRMESDCCKARLASLQQDFKKMEEMVQSMIKFKSRIEQLKHEKSALTVNYENKLKKFQTYITSLEKENHLLLNELMNVECTSPGVSSVLEESDPPVSHLLLERLRVLEQENTSLALENEQQKLQYERCLDDVANQVVQALLAQKSLREECAKLQCRVQDLEEQNQALTLLFRQRFLPQASKENDGCWMTSSENRSDSETGNRLKPQEEMSQNRKSGGSSESLPSLCSSYSLQSCSSGAHPVTGCSKLSSPPQWIRDKQLPRPVCAATSLLCERALRATSSTQLGLWASLLQRHDCLMASALGPRDDGNFLTYQKVSRLNRSPRQSQDWLNLDLSQRSKRLSLPLSDVADLDSMETPSDKSFSLDNLPVLNSSKIFGSDFSGGLLQPSSTVPSDSRASVYYQLHRSGNVSHSLLLASPPRPTSLNIVPHIIGDPTQKFSFEALERKSHQVNSSGNVYEDNDIPVFSESSKSDPGLISATHFSKESVNCDNNSLPYLTDTVIRRHESQTMPVDLSVHQHALDSTFCPNTSGHGRDDGYSTMSSDMQVESNATVASYTVSPPILSSESILQPHLLTMLSNSDILMVSSTDSGLSLQLRGVQPKRRASQEDETFVHQIDGSLTELENPNEEANESGQLDSGLGGSPSVNKITSFKDQSDSVSSILENQLLEDLRYHRTTLDYDKILTLLTPRGFKPTDTSSRPSSVIQNVGSDIKIETAEKSTATEPETICRKFTDTNSCASSCSMDCLDRPVVKTEKAQKNSSEWQDLLDIYCVSCKHCRLRNRQTHNLKFASRVEALGRLLRAFSDSHLVIRQSKESATPLAVRADSLGNRCPPLRLNLLPLERHCSAYDLSPQNEIKSLSTNCESNVKGSIQEGESEYYLQDDQARQLESSEGAAGGTLSMHRSHSSASSSGGEMAASAGEEEEEEEEEEGSTSAVVNFTQELTSDSENDTLESNSFVEQWLEQRTDPLPQRIQNGYEYDDDEVGNWSLQLSSEDLSQSSVLTSVHWSGEWTSQNDVVQIVTQPLPTEGNRLACIRENDLEVDKVVLETQEKNITEEKDTSVIVSEMDGNEDNNDCPTNDGCPVNDSCPPKSKLESGAIKTPAPMPPETEEDVQFEVSEFNRDFYRLCSMDSSRSLDTSIRSLVGGGICTCPDPRHHRHVHAVDAQKNVSLDADSVKSGAKPIKTKRPHSVVSGKENKSLKASVERRKSSSRSRERIQSGTTKISDETKNCEKSKVPVVPKSSCSNISQQGKRSSIPKRETDEKIKKTEKTSTPKLKQSDGGKITSPLRPGHNLLRVPGSRPSSGSDGARRISSTRNHSKEKKRSRHVPITKDLESSTVKQNRLHVEKKLSKKDSEARNRVELSLESVEFIKKSISEGGKWKRSKEGCETSWVHFEADVDLSDPKARANLLDSMMASSSSGSSSDAEELVLVVREQGQDGAVSGEEPQVQQHQHLHALHRIRRHKKRVTDPDAVLGFLPRLRASIIDRHEFYYRFGEKEREAVACFDFLNDLSTSPSDVDTADNANSAKTSTTNNNTIADEASNRLSLDETKLFSQQNSPHNSFSSTTFNSQECDHISFSDSCAESYSSTQSLNRVV